MTRTTHKTRHWKILGGTLLTLGLGVACGTPNGARREEVDALRQEIRDQRERQAVLDRKLQDMDTRLALIADKLGRQGGAPVADGAPPQVGRPPLGVVKLAPRNRPSAPPVVVDQDAPVIELDESDEEGLRLGVDDSSWDEDSDSSNNGIEFATGTNPAAIDTDGDGRTDGQEASGGTDPLDPASP